ncbi:MULTISPECIES: MFS transporter [unclassified Nocardioides]|uniref:MFS transporter n=1 Tax=unclassified Nocardioides TaxID=2615069 RepID=UPI00070309BE|nr:MULTISPECIES: MFS transporter [unclassified Nocardioides]KRC58936.1 MFS transporter [Nocardioides sp. Root79]KRC76743.1 MFS transporter [Nocardioides sp. Root240]
MSGEPGSTPGRRYTVWAVGLGVYALAVFHRSSLAVAGLAATERFDISASQLASFTMLQLLVYASMQIPVGLMVDRFGSRTVLTVAVTVVSTGQAAFAFADDYPTALLARALVGVGDAMTFICVLRLVTSWFPRGQVPLVSQLTGNLGQLGALAAAAPMTWALGELGWTRSYLAGAIAGLVMLVVLRLVLHDSPTQAHLRGVPMTARALARSLAASWEQPGTRLGLWIHFSTPFSPALLGLLWGFPFLVSAEHRSEATAGALISVLFLTNLAYGPLMGWLVGRHPWHRSTLGLTIVAAMATVWAAVLLWPGDAPLWLLVVLIVVVGAGGPGSMVGFDVARTSNPDHRSASASGIINVGGFTSSLLVIVGVGIVLDALSGGDGSYTPEAFRWAMAVQYVLWALGSIQILRYRRRIRSLTTREQVAGGNTMVEVGPDPVSPGGP